ncbi:MAG: copper chaperone PCu(A)C [Azovibrio sp.]
MNKYVPIIAVAALLNLFASSLGYTQSNPQADTHANPQVSITDPWVRATTSQQKATGAFMKLKSEAPVTLVGASSPIANVVEVHEMATVDNVMKMHAIPHLPLPAGTVVELKPGSYHIMLMELKGPVATGQKVPVTLIFENAQKQRYEQTVEAEARPLNTPAAPPVAPTTAPATTPAPAHNGAH